MRTIKIFLIFIFFISCCTVQITSCTFDNEEVLLENFECDTINISYNDLTYIFTDICSVCHKKGDTRRVGIEMDTYESVKSSINTGLVLPAIEHTGRFDMPSQQPKLSDCAIDKIEAWINSGMPENKK